MNCIGWVKKSVGAGLAPALGCPDGGIRKGCPYAHINIGIHPNKGIRKGCPYARINIGIHPNKGIRKGCPYARINIFSFPRWSVGTRKPRTFNLAPLTC